MNIGQAIKFMVEKMDQLEKKVTEAMNSTERAIESFDKRLSKYEDNYRPTHSNKIDLNRYIKENLGESYEENEPDKVKKRVLLMFDVEKWQDIPLSDLLSQRGMALVDDSILSVKKFRVKEQISLFIDSPNNKRLRLEDKDNNFPRL